MNDAYLTEIIRLMRTKFTGSITLHVQEGSIRKLDSQATWRPEKTTGPVDISEAGGLTGGGSR